MALTKEHTHNTDNGTIIGPLFDDDVQEGDLYTGQLGTWWQHCNKAVGKDADGTHIECPYRELIATGPLTNYTYGLGVYREKHRDFLHPSGTFSGPVYDRRGFAA